MENKEMQLAWQIVANTDRSLFLSGKAGTGKTTFLRRLREQTPKRMVVLAPTGVAAINANGQTIHSFFQLPFGPIVPGSDNQRKSFKLRQQKKDLIRTLDLLVIDEISMVRADLLDAIDTELRKYRDRSKSFGGVQLLLIGDLHQLAPVAKEAEWRLLSPFYDTPYFFSSNALRNIDFAAIELKHIYRQQDAHFIEILGKVRNNTLDDAAAADLNRRYVADFEAPDNENWIRLTTHNRMADEYNERKLADLPTTSFCYKAKVDGEFPESIYPADIELELKQGAQVMFIKNDPSGNERFYNGKIGTVEAISDEAVAVRTAEDDELIKVTPLQWDNTKFTLNEKSKEIEEVVEGHFTQLPLRLAWAITVHKSQGLTFDHAVLDINESFAHGQVYVALSRCRSLEGMVLTRPIYRSAIRTDYTVNRFVEESQHRSEGIEQHLPAMKQQYHISLLDALFDFKQMEYQVENLRRVVDEHFGGKEPALRKGCDAAIEALRNGIQNVAARFSRQYRQLIAAADNDALQTRLKASAAYFKPLMEKALKPVFDNLPETITNKAVAERFTNALQPLKETEAIKSCLFDEILANGFEVKSYLEAKARSLLKASDVKETTRENVKKSMAPAANAGAAWTVADEREMIRLYETERMSMAAIGRLLGRSGNSISSRLKKLGKK